MFERTISGRSSLLANATNGPAAPPVGGGSTPERLFSTPFDVTTCRGHVYVSDTTDRTVVAFDVAHRRVHDIGTRAPGTLLRPLGLSTDRDCNLYVADAERGQVMVFGRDGSFLRAVGEKRFQRLTHVAVSTDGKRLFAVDTGLVAGSGHQVRVFDAVSGDHLLDIGRRGNRPGEFDLPQDAEVGPDDMLYVVDGANFRVQVFSLDGALVRVFGRVGRKAGQFSRPKGIALDPMGRVYVSDAAFGNFQLFDPQGELLLFVGRRSSRPGPAAYMLPAGIHVDEDGRVLLVDQFFRKVDVYRPAALPRELGFLGAWYDRP